MSMETRVHIWMDTGFELGPWSYSFRYSYWTGSTFKLSSWSPICKTQSIRQLLHFVHIVQCSTYAYLISQTVSRSVLPFSSLYCHLFTQSVCSILMFLVSPTRNCIVGSKFCLQKLLLVTFFSLIPANMHKNRFNHVDVNVQASAI